MGLQAGYANTTGGYNLCVGASSGYTNSTGIYNTCVGNGAGYYNQSGSYNTFLGLNSGFKTVGSDNVTLGFSAGLENTTGYRNTFIGSGAGVTTANPNLVNATAIGYNAHVSASNSLVLGDGVNVGIGNAAPQNKLEITHGSTGFSGLRLTNLTSSFSPSVSASKFLTVNANGDVYLATYSSGAREAAVESLWQREGAYLKSANNEPIIVGQGVRKTPAGYSLFVGQGILTEKVKVAVKTTDDWSDKVFTKGYKLLTLSEVAGYIHQHQHLPGVPSAQEMIKNGNDLHRTDAKLLEKIEELTLYLIEQRNELEAIRQQNKQMKEELSVLKAKINH